jgi:hypothetical protein
MTFKTLASKRYSKLCKERHRSFGVGSLASMAARAARNVIEHNGDVAEALGKLPDHIRELVETHGCPLQTLTLADGSVVSVRQGDSVWYDPKIDADIWVLNPTIRSISSTGYVTVYGTPRGTTKHASNLRRSYSSWFLLPSCVTSVHPTREYELLNGVALGMVVHVARCNSCKPVRAIVRITSEGCVLWSANRHVCESACSAKERDDYCFVMWAELFYEYRMQVGEPWDDRPEETFDLEKSELPTLVPVETREPTFELGYATFWVCVTWWGSDDDSDYEDNDRKTVLSNARHLRAWCGWWVGRVSWLVVPEAGVAMSTSAFSTAPTMKARLCSYLTKHWVKPLDHDSDALVCT